MKPVLFYILIDVNPQIQIPQDIYTIDEILHAAGFQLYIVGGAVRNMVMGTDPADWDLASDAEPDEVISLFKHVLPIGIQHGTVTIRLNKNNYEITTFRVDGAYSDSRHPDNIEYSPNIHEDLQRRDFTINAMAYDLRKDQLLDPYGGQADLRSGTIRTVRNPAERFSEDGLRIIRGIRFASVLSFTIHEDTREAMGACAANLRGVSIERIREEFSKILCSARPSLGMRMAADTGILGYYMPLLNEAREINLEDSGSSLFDYLLASCDHVPGKLELRFAALLHRIAETTSEHQERAGGAQASESADMAQSVCRQLRCSRAFEKRVQRLIANHAYPIHPDMSDAETRHFVSAVGTDLILDLLSLQESTIHTPVDWLEELKARIVTMLRDGTALNISDLPINGHELHTLAGIPKNREMQNILAQLLEMVLKNPDMNRKDLLVQRAREMYQNSGGKKTEEER